MAGYSFTALGSGICLVLAPYIDGHTYPSLHKYSCNRYPSKAATYIGMVMWDDVVYCTKAVIKSLLVPALRLPLPSLPYYFSFG